jgi:hypothetical protein
MVLAHTNSGPLSLELASSYVDSKNIRISNLGCDYYFNKNAWMTSKIFAHWIRGFDIEMRQLNKKALLTLDNFSGHKVSVDIALPQLENIELYYLPPTPHQYCNHWTPVSLQNSSYTIEDVKLYALLIGLRTSMPDVNRTRYLTSKDQRSLYPTSQMSQDL